MIVRKINIPYIRCLSTSTKRVKCVDVSALKCAISQLPSPANNASVKQEILALGKAFNIDDKKHTSIIASLVTRSISSDGFHTLLLASRKLMNSESEQYTRMIDLLNICIKKHHKKKVLILYSYITTDIKLSLDILTFERLVYMLAKDCDLENLERFLDDNQISDNIMVYISEAFIMSGKLSTYYKYFHKYIANSGIETRDKKIVDLPTPETVSRVIRAVMMARQRRLKSRSDQTDEEYEYMGKLFESIEFYHSLLISSNIVNITELESYFSYQQLYKLESESLDLPETKVSYDLKEAMSALPNFEFTGFPFVTEDRLAPHNKMTSYESHVICDDKLIDDKSDFIINDLTTEFIRENAANGKLLLYSKDLFTEDYYLELLQLQKKSSLGELMSSLAQVDATLSSIFDIRPSYYSAAVDMDDEEEDDDDYDDSSDEDDDSLDADDDSSEDDDDSSDDDDDELLGLEDDDDKQEVLALRSTHDHFNTLETSRNSLLRSSHESLDDDDDDEEDEEDIDDYEDDMDDEMAMNDDDWSNDAVSAFSQDDVLIDLLDEAVRFHDTEDPNLLALLEKLDSMGKPEGKVMGVPLSDLTAMNSECSAWKLSTSFLSGSRMSSKSQELNESLGSNFYDRIRLNRRGTFNDRPHDDDGSGGLTQLTSRTSNGRGNEYSKSVPAREENP